MEVFNITDWGSGTYRVAISNQIKYVEIYDNTGKFISDAYTLQLTNYGQLVLEHENYEGASFPLMVVGFDTAEINGGEGLFNRQPGVPFSSVRFGIGKRHETARNVRFDELCKYVNDNGSIYVTKDFDGINYSTARQNLEVYSKEEINNKIVGVDATNVYTYTSYKYDIRPFYAVDNEFITSFERFSSRYKQGTMNVTLSINTIGYNLAVNGAMKICSSQDAVGTPNLLPSAPVIAFVEMPTLPQSANLMMGYSTVGTTTINSLHQLPIMIMTAGAMRYCGYDLDANSIYMICNWTPVAPNMGVPWMQIDPAGVNLKWTLTYYPNDEQLR